MILNTSTVTIDESGISISKTDNIVTVGGTLQNWSYPALVDRVALSTQSPFAISFS